MVLAKAGGQLHVEQDIKLCPPSPILSRWLQFHVMIEYTFDEHRHNYSVWTAARAVSRNFTSTCNVKDAINYSGIRSFAEGDFNPTQDEFDQLHIQWSQKLIERLTQLTNQAVTYGRAAKNISIYLKTSVILCSRGECAKSKEIHAPIDRILLNNISKRNGAKQFSKEKWTQLNQSKYWDLIDRLRFELGTVEWKIEYYWQPDRDS